MTKNRFLYTPSYFIVVPRSVQTARAFLLSSGVKRSTHSDLSMFWIPISPSNPGYLHSPEMGSSSSVSPWSIGVLSLPAAAPAWPLVALDAFHSVADDTHVLDDTPPVLDNTLPGVAPVLDDTLPGVPPVFNDALRPAADLFPGVQPSVP